LITGIPPPNALGAPDRFSQWRNGQDAACLRAIDTDKRFLALTLSTGSGKSLIYMVSALATGRRTAVLTATKALQTQLLHDFMEAGLVDVRGQVNYRCAEIPGQSNNTAYHGPCHHGYECPRKGGGCEYFDAVRTAGKARLVVTNYAYWISQHKHGEGLGKFDLLVCDEAAEAPEELSRSLTITLEAYDLRFTGVRAWPQTDSLSEWKTWATTAALQVGQMYKGLRGEARSAGVDGGVRRRARELKELAWKLEDLSRAQGEWVIDRRGKAVSLCPLWPAEYAERNLFLRIPRVILTSATIRMKTLSLLGIPESEVEIEDCPSSFPVQNRLVTHIPTVRLNHRSSEADVTVWVMRMDQIIGRRLDRKGIIHTVCVSPETRVLTSELRWKPAGSINQGQTLVAFDEMPSSGVGGCRKWRESVVEKAEIRERPCVRLFLEDGTSLVCAHDHLWLTHNGMLPRWTRADRLMTGMRAASRLMKVIEPWGDEYDWRHGYLAAAFDGEGHMYQHRYRKGRNYCANLALVFSQKDNCMLSKVRRLLDELGFTHSYPPSNGKRSVKRVAVSQKHQVLRFLGSVRPERLLAKFSLGTLGKFAMYKRLRVLQREFIGMAPVAFLSTSSKTYIAEGFASHNSYDRMRVITERSAYKDLMITHRPGGVAGAVNHFKKADPPAILVSPSVTTGVDFPDSDCRYQIIAKIPFPDGRDPLVKARTDADPEYGLYLAMQSVIQACGRGVRSEKDFCETLIVDDMWSWFYSRNQHLAPGWFREAVRRSVVIPVPMKE
jgi:Rad3-related DNA helicase